MSAAPQYDPPGLWPPGLAAPGFLPAVDPANPPPVPQEWCGWDDLLRLTPSVQILKNNRVDSSTCVEVIRVSTAEILDEMAMAYDPIPGLTRRRLGPAAALGSPPAAGTDARAAYDAALKVEQLRREFGDDIPDPHLALPTKPTFAAWLRAGRLEVTPPLREASARRALAIVLGRAAAHDGDKAYTDARDFMLREATARLATFSARVDADGDGVADWEVNPAGRRVVWLGGGA